MSSKLARGLWLFAVLLYVVSIGLRLSQGRPLGMGDGIGAVILGVVGWSVLRKPKT